MKSLKKKSQWEQREFNLIFPLQKIKFPEWVDKENTLQKNMLFQQTLRAIFIKQNPERRSQKKMASQRIFMEHINYNQHEACGNI